MSIVPQKPFLFDVSVEENIKIKESKYTSMTIKKRLRFLIPWDLSKNFP